MIFDPGIFVTRQGNSKNGKDRRDSYSYEGAPPLPPGPVPGSADTTEGAQYENNKGKSEKGKGKGKGKGRFNNYHNNNWDRHNNNYSESDGNWRQPNHFRENNNNNNNTYDKKNYDSSRRGNNYSHESKQRESPPNSNQGKANPSSIPPPPTLPPATNETPSDPSCPTTPPRPMQDVPMSNFPTSSSGAAPPMPSHEPPRGSPHPEDLHREASNTSNALSNGTRAGVNAPPLPSQPPPTIEQQQQAPAVVQPAPQVMQQAPAMQPMMTPFNQQLTMQNQQIQSLMTQLRQKESELTSLKTEVQKTQLNFSTLQSTVQNTLPQDQYDKLYSSWQETLQSQLATMATPEQPPLPNDAAAQQQPNIQQQQVYAVPVQMNMYNQQYRPMMAPVGYTPISYAPIGMQFMQSANNAVAAAPAAPAPVHDPSGVQGDTGVPQLKSQETNGSLNAAATEFQPGQAWGGFSTETTAS